MFTVHNKNININIHQKMTSALLLVLLIAIPLTTCTAGQCPAETQCYGHGDWTAATQTCKCYSNGYNKQWESRYGSYTGECCTSVECSNPNSTCAHGICSDGKNCARCQTDWTGKDCDNATSCFPWLPCKHGKCVKSRYEKTLYIIAQRLYNTLIKF